MTDVKTPSALRFAASMLAAPGWGWQTCAGYAGCSSASSVGCGREDSKAMISAAR